MKKFIYSLLLAGPIILATSCNKYEDFGETNVDPGGVSVPVVGALLVSAQNSQGGYAAMTRGGLYSQMFSETQYTDVSLYNLPQVSHSGEYAGILMNLQDIINRNLSNNQNMAAKIIQQHVFWTITDRWGDVPYSEALQGAASLTPKYDRQEDIYKGMISALTDAVNGFDNTSVITGDIVYGGDVDMWKKYANSLRMLMALQLSDRYPGASDYAATEFKAALNDPAGYIDDNSENYTIPYEGSVYKNSWWNVYNGRKDYGESATMTSLMGSLSDQRQQAFGGKTELDDPTHPDFNVTSNKGVPYGRTRTFTEAWTGANPDWARILRSEFRVANAPQVIIAAAHVTLARAEAADRGWTTENLQALYELGISQSYEQWGFSAPPSTYYSQAGVALSAPAGTGANIQPIAIQRYIAFYPDGLQGWNIWRKTGYPTLTPAPDAVNTSGQIPRRYVYHPTEYATNKAATEAAAAQIGGDTQDTRVWWDMP